MAKKDDKKLLETARERFKRCVEADQENRRKAVDDLKFLHVPGEQWDQALKSERGNRPNYEFNKLRVTIKRIVNDIRANRPQAKVRAVEDGDKDTAATLEGLCRNIWSVSDGDSAVDTAAEYSVGAGMGAWRVTTKYSTDDAWDQDIVIESIRNPLSLWCDPSARDNMKRDAEFWFLESKMTKDAYKSKYGDKPAIEWEASEFDDDEEWGTEDSDAVRICEYWYRKPVTKTLALLSDGQTVDAEETPASALGDRQVTRTRQVQTHQICMAIIAGDKVLEGPTEWAGSKFPFVQIYGEHLFIDGKTHWFGLTRFAKDAQRSYNYSRTLAVEAVALAPQAKYWATPTQAQGHTEMWARAHKENLPFQLFNADPQQPGAPQRMGGADIPAALINEMQIASEDIKAVTGIFDNSLGQKANEASGVAIRARQAQGEIATFNFSDNVARGVRYTHEILVDLIPKIYDSERSIRILGADGAEQYAKVNAINPITGEVTNDLSRGKFDVAVTVGPNMGTQRQEAAEVYMGLMQGNPGLFPVVGDLVVKTFDYPYSDEMAERLRLMAPPQIQQMLAQKEQNGGKALDPQAQAAMAQAEQMMQQVQQMSQLVQQAEQELMQMKSDVEGEKAAAEKAKADVQIAIANLKVQEAELQSAIVTAQAEMAQREMAMQAQGKDIEHAGQQMESQAMQAGEQNAVSIVQDALKAVSEQIKALEQAMRSQPQQQPMIVQMPSNRLKGIKKTNGGFQPEYED